MKSAMYSVVRVRSAHNGPDQIRRAPILAWSRSYAGAMDKVRKLNSSRRVRGTRLVPAIVGLR